MSAPDIPEHGGPVRNWSDAVLVWPALARFEPHCDDETRQGVAETLGLAHGSYVTEEQACEEGAAPQLHAVVFVFAGDAARYHAERLFRQFFHAIHKTMEAEGIGVRIVVETTLFEIEPPVKH